MKLSAQFKYESLCRWMRREQLESRRLAEAHRGLDGLPAPNLHGRAVALGDALMKAKLLNKGQRAWR